MKELSEKMHRGVRIAVMMLLIMPAYPPFTGSANPAPDKKVKFSWEAIDWAIRYRVEIRDASGKTVLQKEVDASSIEFSLPPGKYTIRIGAINKFEKFSGWSDWAETEIMEKRARDTMALNLGINISAGVPYSRALPSWDSALQNTMKGFTGKIGFNFGNFILLRPSDAIRYRGPLSYFGLELEGSYIDFPAKSGTVRIGKKETTGGGSLFFRTNFDLPVNFLARGGGGIAESRFTYSGANLIKNNIEAKSQDPYYKFGGSLEVNVFGDFILEGGADYMVITYLKSPMKSIRYFLMLGIRL